MFRRGLQLIEQYRKILSVVESVKSFYIGINNKIINEAQDHSSLWIISHVFLFSIKSNTSKFQMLVHYILIFVEGAF